MLGDKMEAKLVNLNEWIDTHPNLSVLIALILLAGYALFLYLKLSQ